MSDKRQINIVDPRIIVAMDMDSLSSCQTLASKLDPSLCRVKVGKELFTREGPAVVEALVTMGFSVFLDLKFHDIPHTVAQAVKVAANLGIWMLNVHSFGGLRMMEAAREALEQSNGNRPLLIGVTLLTSMSAEDLHDLGCSSSLEEQVLRLATLAHRAGLDGVVCSAQEAQLLKQHLGQEFLLVTPGVRPVDSAKDDQRRIVTPEQAVTWGSDYLVIGRPITRAPDSAAACRQIVESIKSII